MKRLYSLLMLALVCLLAAAPSYGQSDKVKFSVSFPFIAGAAAMPAGSYSITEDVSGHAMIFPAQGGHGTFILPTRYSGFSPSNGHATVSFIKRDGRYYLNTVNLLDGRIIGIGKIPQ